MNKANTDLHTMIDQIRTPPGISGPICDDVRKLEADIERLEQWVDDCQSGMYINCVYCGHRYGPDDGDHLTSMRDALTAHVEQCPKHPLSMMKSQRDNLAGLLRVALKMMKEYEVNVEDLNPKYRREWMKQAADYLRRIKA